MRRTYADAGLTVKGYTKDGAILTSTSDVVIHNISGKGYSWSGVYPEGGYIVTPETDPTLDSNFTNESGNLLIGNLSGGGSLAHSHAVLNVDMPPYNGDLSSAIDAAPEGACLVLGARDYDITGKYGNGAGSLAKGLKFYGVGMPNLSADRTRFVTGSGTVIQGTLASNADNFHCFDLGIDCGSYVVDTLNGGVYMEGFVPANIASGTPSDYSSYSQNVHFGNIKILMKTPTSDPATAKHACLVENCYGGSHGYVECIGGYHGFVMKSVGMIPKGPVVAYGQTADSAIFKSDANSYCANYVGGTLILGRTGWTTKGMILEPTNTMANISFDLNLNSIAGDGVMNAGGTFPATDISIPNLFAANVTGQVITVPAWANRWKIGRHSMVTCRYGIRVNAGAYLTQIGDGVAQVIAETGYIFGAPVTHGYLHCIECSGYDVSTAVPMEKEKVLFNKDLYQSANILSTYDSLSLITVSAGWSKYNLVVIREPNRYKLARYFEVSGAMTEEVCRISQGKPKRTVTAVCWVIPPTGTAYSALVSVTSAGVMLANGLTGLAIGTKLYVDMLSWSTY